MCIRNSYIKLPFVVVAKRVFLYISYIGMRGPTETVGLFSYFDLIEYKFSGGTAI